MMDVCPFGRPNSVKVPIALEEIGAPCKLIGVDVRRGEQSRLDCLALNPDGKIPVIVDGDGPGGSTMTTVGSGAILVSLTETFGRLLPADPRDRIRALERLFFQGAGLGPMFGQSGYFPKSALEKVQFAIDHSRRRLSL